MQEGQVGKNEPSRGIEPPKVLDRYEKKSLLHVNELK